MPALTWLLLLTTEGTLPQADGRGHEFPRAGLDVAAVQTARGNSGWLPSVSQAPSSKHKIFHVGPIAATSTQRGGACGCCFLCCRLLRGKRSN